MGQSVANGEPGDATGGGNRERWHRAESTCRVPLAVDFDGTICLADTLAWLRARAVDRGPETERQRAAARAVSKQDEKVFLWEHVGLDPDELPFDHEVLADLADLQETGEDLVLVTGSAQGLADAASRHLGLFVEALGSTTAVNLTGPRKAAALVARYGLGGYDYIGDSPADLPVWESARQGYVVWRPTTPPFTVPPRVVRIDSSLAVRPPPGRAELFARDDSWPGTAP